jgi:nicotinamidase/pyrazinamidase
MKTLLLVDLQNDFLPGGALAVPEGDQVIEVANRLMPHFPLVVASQDWHPVGHGSFASQHPGRHVGDQVILDELEQILWPDHCIQGTWGAAFPDRLHQGSIRSIFCKGTDPQIDSYSALYDNGHRRSTGLAEYLRSQNVMELYIMGLATDFCVRYTALDALASGFQIWIITDGCRGVNLQPGDDGRSLEAMRSAGALLTTSEKVLNGSGPSPH